MENQNIQQSQNPETNPQSPVSETPQTPLPNDPINRTSKFSIKAIIGTVIFLLLAGGAAAAGYVYRDPLMKLVSAPAPSPTVSVSPTPTPPFADGPTINMKRFVNAQFGFSLQYPDTFTVTEHSLPTPPYHSNLFAFAENRTDPSKQPLLFLLSFTNNPKSIEQILEEKPDYKFVEKKTINNLEFTVIRNGEQFNQLTYLARKDDNVIAFWIQQPNEDLNLLESVVGTFKLNTFQTLASKDLENIKTNLALQEKVEVENIIDFTSEVYKDPIYASGNFSIKDTPGSGAKWFAQKVNSEWEILQVGNGMPNCTDVAKYNAPKEFLACY